MRLFTHTAMTADSTDGALPFIGNRRIVNKRAGEAPTPKPEETQPRRRGMRTRMLLR
jgi:hypothetical protein